MTKIILDFNFSKMTEEDWNNFLNNFNYDDDFIGHIYLGDISIDVLYKPEVEVISFDYYVLNEDSGYGYISKNGVKSTNSNPIYRPYDYADGNDMKFAIGEKMSYLEFCNKARLLICKYIYSSKYVGPTTGMSLSEHAEQNTEVW